MPQPLAIIANVVKRAIRKTGDLIVSLADEHEAHVHAEGGQIGNGGGQPSAKLLHNRRRKRTDSSAACRPGAGRVRT
jgi:hypothetical protein